LAHSRGKFHTQYPNDSVTEQQIPNGKLTKDEIPSSKQLKSELLNVKNYRIVKKEQMAKTAEW
jgi:hypothetical protein